MEDRSSRRMRILVTHLAPVRGLPANQIACALISMMAGSTCSNQRPDTLMQDRIARIEETSCTARPDHTYGSYAEMLKLSISSPLPRSGRASARAPSFFDH